MSDHNKIPRGGDTFADVSQHSPAPETAVELAGAMGLFGAEQEAFVLNRSAEIEEQLRGDGAYAMPEEFAGPVEDIDDLLSGDGDLGRPV